jgi:hypothetical protein
MPVMVVQEVKAVMVAEVLVVFMAIRKLLLSWDLVVVQVDLFGLPQTRFKALGSLLSMVKVVT